MRAISQRELNSYLPVLDPHSNTNFRIGEFFCGPGGIGLAAKNTTLRAKKNTYKFEHCWAIDNDKDSCETYKRNVIGKGDQNKVFHADIRTFPILDLEPVDGLFFGFPCNDFSLAGESKGLQGEYGSLYKYGVEFIDQKNPLFFVAENVSGLSSVDKGKAFRNIINDLKDAGQFGGYNLTTHLFKFDQYGVPQFRRRYIIVGFRQDLELVFEVPRPDCVKQSASAAIESPPIPSDASSQELTAHSDTVVERLKHIQPGQNAWNSDLPEHLKLNVQRAKLSMVYRRLDPNKPAYTVTGSGGGGTHVYHWAEPRALTNRERARLQTFPDDFEFCGSKESVRRQIGMAVPVIAAQHILKAILKTIAGVKYTSVHPSVVS